MCTCDVEDSFLINMIYHIDYTKTVFLFDEWTCALLNLTNEGNFCHIDYTEMVFGHDFCTYVDEVLTVSEMTHHIAGTDVRQFYHLYVITCVYVDMTE